MFATEHVRNRTCSVPERFAIEHVRSPNGWLPNDRKEIPSDITAASLLEQYFSSMNYNITFSLVGLAGYKLKVGVNNKENYANLMSANMWPDKVGNVGIPVIKPSYIPDAFGIVVRFADEQYDDEFVKSEIERNFQSAENIRKINYAFQRRNNDYRFNVKDLREYNSALQRGRFSIGNNLCSITPFKTGNRMTFCPKCWCLSHFQDKCQANARCRLCLEELVSGQTRSCSSGSNCAQCNEDHHSPDGRCEKIKEYHAELKQEVNKALADGRLYRIEPFESPNAAFQYQQNQFPPLQPAVNSHPAPWFQPAGSSTVPIPAIGITTNNSASDLSKTLLSINENLVAMRNSSNRIVYKYKNDYLMFARGETSTIYFYLIHFFDRYPQKSINQ
ncbi:unnamed protein product [Didymodactylos carnosus]|uniref:Uncharacterized protein n=1 Tax=Didymodactylos carnosus TaxID=1234261 RepID=A0A815WP29_9BILA|nr:unnamed protein product [Didymodactylos carnosus]CAF4409276.1 unnamed protein product [Didymodactylos carnosus]